MYTEKEELDKAIRKIPTLSVEEIENRFTYHPPQSDVVKDKYISLRNAGKDLAILINAAVPESREKSLAITKLEEVIMWANAGIARNS